MGKCINFDNELWFYLGNSMCKKHRSVFQDHIKYIYNDIVKLFRVGILRQAERVQEMHDLDKKLPPPWMNGESYESANWDVRDRYLSEN